MPTIIVYDRKADKKHEMSVRGTHTIDSIKAVLARELGYRQGDVNLYLNKAVLSDGRQTVRALGLQDEDLLELSDHMLKLPDEIFWRRLEEEIKEVANHEDFEIEKKGKLDFVVTVKAKGYEPSQRMGGSPRKRDTHKVHLFVPRGYPYESPKLNWLTPILHSNICPPDEEYSGVRGFVCIEGLNYYKPFSLNLLSLCESIRNIIENPNPASTIPTKTPKKASEFFRRNIPPLRDEPVLLSRS